MCVTHICGLAGAAQVGPPQKSGAHRHAQQPPTPHVGIGAWPIGLRRIPGAPKVPRGSAAVCTSATSGVGGGGGHPPKPMPWGQHAAEPEPWRPKRRPAGQIHQNWGGFSAGISTAQARSIFGALQA